MEVSEQELRAMVREAIAPALGTTGTPCRRRPATAGCTQPRLSAAWPRRRRRRACLIEPAVRCNHCGYCLSLGH